MPSNREMMVTKLQRIAEKARSDSGCRFTSLFHLMNIEMLRECFRRLRKDAAVGIDKVTKEDYAVNLEENLAVLVEKLHKMSYIPLPVRRVYIPKAGSKKKRPLGIPGLEDKLVQAGLARILTAIYEHALRALSKEVEGQRIHYIVDADIKGFFDNVDHNWLIEFLGHRIADKRVLRYVKRFLIAGIMEEGAVSASDKGTPQGGIVSPILANIYLHYSLDLWFTRVFQKSCCGQSRLIRYADDFVVCFQREADATRFYQELGGRLARFGLEISLEKTKIIGFGPFAESKAKGSGGKAATFDFLGFTHYCSRSRNGRYFRMKRITSCKKFAAKVRMFRDWLKANRTLPTREIMEKVVSKLRGHFAYYGVTDNSKGIRRFAYEIRRILFKWLNRRGQRGGMNWDKFNLFLKKFPLPIPRITVNLFA